MSDVKKLVRPRTGRTLAGVCKGLADYFGLDATIVRVLFAIVTLVTAIVPCLIFYVVLMLIIPEGE